MVVLLDKQGWVPATPYFRLLKLDNRLVKSQHVILSYIALYYHFYLSGFLFFPSNGSPNIVIVAS
jgi:hypothetical protein